MNIFEQSTGVLSDAATGEMRGNGYAGRNYDDAGKFVGGKNNPAMEGVKGIGPLPCGNYKAAKLWQNHPTVGKFAIQLEPDAATRAKIIALGRNPDSFFMHGDSYEHPGLASHGCIVQQLNVRDWVWNNDRDIEVVPVKAKVATVTPVLVATTV